MKAKLFFVLCLAVSSLTACGDNITFIQQNELPQTAQQFLNQHFGDLTVSFVSKDFHSFDVKFTNGAEIDFDKNGNWTEIDCEMNPVPEGIIPEAIATYVKTNFANNFIVQISKEYSHYDVELNNGLDLVFDKNGNFKHVDY